MSDEWLLPGYKPKPQAPRPGELLFEFVRESDHAQFRCELRDHSEWGVEAQIFRQGELWIRPQVRHAPAYGELGRPGTRVYEKGDE